MRFLLGVVLRHVVKPWPPFLRDTQLLLRWAVGSALLIGVVLVLRRLLAEKLSCRLRYALWGVVLLRLLIPFQLPISTPVSAARLAPEVPQSWEERDVPVFPYSTVDFENAHPHYANLEPGYLGPTDGSDFYIQRSEDGQTLTYFNDVFTRDEVIQAVWWTGVLATGVVLLVSNLRFAIRLDDRRRPLEVSGCPLRVYAAEGLPSPCLFGLFHPAVYLTPEVAENEGTRRHVLAHELTHYAHKDHIWAFLRCLALALHWYNPLVWLAVVLSKRDGELACDEGAVARLGEDQRIPYGRTLVDMVARRSLRPSDLLSCSTSMAQGKKTIQQRVALLVKKPETKKTALFAALAAVALAVVFTFAGGEVEEAPGDDYTGFRDQVASAQAIHVGMPLYSSFAYPSPITDDDLLQEAREALDDTIDLWVEPASEEWRDITLAASWITLSADGENFDQRYGLYQENNQYCLLFQWSPEMEPTNRVVAILQADTLSTLISLAEEQQEWDGAASIRQELEVVQTDETGNSAELEAQEQAEEDGQGDTATPAPEEIDVGGLALEEPDGGSSEPVIQWGAGQEFSPDMEVAMEWNTDLRAVVSKDGDKAGMKVSGDTGALYSLSVGINGVSFDPYHAGGLVDTYVWGETLDALSWAGACLNRDETPDASPAGRAEVAKWLRVTKNGQDVPGVLSWGHGNGSSWFNFDFDTPLAMEAGDVVAVEIGPAR